VDQPTGEIGAYDRHLSEHLGSQAAVRTPRSRSCGRRSAGWARQQHVACPYEVRLSSASSLSDGWKCRAADVAARSLPWRRAFLSDRARVDLGGRQRGVTQPQRDLPLYLPWPAGRSSRKCVEAGGETRFFFRPGLCRAAVRVLLEQIREAPSGQRSPRALTNTSGAATRPRRRARHAEPRRGST